jgi:hypothetical protein
MPWQCPACHTPIRYQDYDRVLRGPVPFPCHVCQLDLVKDATRNSLLAAPAIERGRQRQTNTAAGSVVAMRAHSKSRICDVADQPPRDSGSDVRRVTQERPRMSQRNASN